MRIPKLASQHKILPMNVSGWKWVSYQQNASRRQAQIKREYVCKTSSTEFIDIRIMDNDTFPVLFGSTNCSVTKCTSMEHNADSPYIIYWILIIPNIKHTAFNSYWIPYSSYEVIMNSRNEQWCSFGMTLKKKKTPRSEFASELYRPSDRCLSVKWLPTFADRGRHVVSMTDSYGRILGFLGRSRYFSIK
jgi:hypothetical protein